MKKLITLITICALIASCGGNSSSSEKSPFVKDGGGSNTNNSNPSYDPNRGTGHFTKADIPPTLDAAMAGNGKKIYEVKCIACHKLTEEKLVGPGWKGVTGRHEAVWIMNFAVYG